MNAAADYDGLVAVVTGAAQGIGASIARGVARRGGSVVISDIDADLVDGLVRDLGECASGLRTDVTSEADLEEMANRAVSAFGRLDVAFNVAGAGRMRSILNMTPREWDFTMDICLKGVVYAMKHEARQMIASGNGGAIVNISSLNCDVPSFAGAPYCTAKAGVAMLTKCGALELAEHGIRVNTVSPGLVETRLTSGLLGSAAAYGAYMERIPLKRPASPDEIAEVALFLGSPGASYVSGSNVFADGAWSVTTYPDIRPATLQQRG
jgi:NAD(P)-dependent dehydrogenase (short-subunit alcohol dehydrogenase family)